jgi:hypothetical protein
MVPERTIELLVVSQTLLLSHLPLPLGDDKVHQTEDNKDTSQNTNRNACLGRCVART